MREVYTDREEAARRGERAAQDIARQLSPEATGAAMRARLQQLAGGGAGPTPAVTPSAGGQPAAGSASGGAPPGLSTSSHS